MATVTLVQDSFDRANAALGTADTGGAWQYSGDKAYNVVGNEATGGAGGAGYAYIEAASQPDVIQASVKVVDVNGVRTGLAFRGVDADNWWITLLYDSGATYAVYTAYYSAGTLTGSQNANVSATVGNYYVLKIVDTGDTVETWWDGSKILTHASTVHNTGKRVGLYIDNGNLRVDNFLATYEGEEPGGLAGLSGLSGLSGIA